MILHPLGQARYPNSVEVNSKFPRSKSDLKGQLNLKGQLVS